MLHSASLWESSLGASRRLLPWTVGPVDGRSRRLGSSRSIRMPRGARPPSARGWAGSAATSLVCFKVPEAQGLHCVTPRLPGKLLRSGLPSWPALTTGMIMLLLNLMPK
ncbi:hypothetical protein ACFX13_007272 [Malus domestica]